MSLHSYVYIPSGGAPPVDPVDGRRSKQGFPREGHASSRRRGRIKEIHRESLRVSQCKWNYKERETETRVVYIIIINTGVNPLLGNMNKCRDCNLHLVNH